MGKLIVMASAKGGAGKTSLAAHLLVEYARRGWDVAGADADPQGSLVQWHAIEGDGPPVYAVGDGARATLADMKGRYDLVIADTAGQQSRRLAGALMVADLAVVPVRPEGMDIFALPATLDTIATAQELNPDLRAALLVNQTDRTVMHKGARPGLEELGVPVLRAELARRIGFSEATTAGQGITSYQPGSVAALELRNVADELAEALGLEEGMRHAEAV